MARAQSSNSIECRICGKELQAINGAHLRGLVHAWTRPHPVEHYKRIFGLRRAISRTTSRKITLSQIARAQALGRHWTRHRVLVEIRRRKMRKLTLRSGQIQIKAPGLHHGARRLFGSWPQALSAAGIDPSTVSGLRTRWTRKEIIHELRVARRERESLPIGTRPKQRLDPGMYHAARKLFGSWIGALQAAGLGRELDRINRKWSRRSIVTELRKLHRLGWRITIRDLRRRGRSSLAAAAPRYFGTWSEAVRVTIAGTSSVLNRNKSRQQR